MCHHHQIKTGQVLPVPQAEDEARVLGEKPRLKKNWDQEIIGRNLI